MVSRTREPAAARLAKAPLALLATAIVAASLFLVRRDPVTGVPALTLVAVLLPARVPSWARILRGAVR